MGKRALRVVGGPPGFPSCSPFKWDLWVLFCFFLYGSREWAHAPWRELGSTNDSEETVKNPTSGRMVLRVRAHHSLLDHCLPHRPGFIFLLFKNRFIYLFIYLSNYSLIHSFISLVYECLACFCLFTCVPWLWRPEEGARTPGTGVKDSCEPPWGVLCQGSLVTPSARFFFLIVVKIGVQ